nr:alginate export family protein [candidate division Zixibacteria bacterium]
MAKKTLIIILLISGVIMQSVASEETAERNNFRHLKISFSERLRLVTWDNTITLADSAAQTTTFTRHRTSLMGQYYPDPKMELALKLTNEFRYYFIPADREFEIDEIFVDQLYLKWNLKKPLDGILTLGRQNIMLGEGFIVMDGHPLDGSRSIYFNAARFDWRITPGHELTVFYSYQEEIDEWLPVINEVDQVLVEQPEEGIGLYYSGRINRYDIQGYYVRKNVDANNIDTLASEINTIGGRIVSPLIESLSVTGEGAFQFGQAGQYDRAAFGGYFHLDYKTVWPSYLPKMIQLGVICLSGDNRATEKDEGWNPIFARWPKWSESYIYTQIKEDRVAWWTNLASLYGRCDFDFTPKINLSLQYHHLMAPRVADPESAFPGGDGHNRGNLFIGLLKFVIDKNLTGHFLWEGFLPGNYYFHGADGYSWVRAELLFKVG